MLAQVRIQLGQGSAMDVTRQVIKNEGVGGLYKVKFFNIPCAPILSSKQNICDYVCLSVFVCMLKFVASVPSPTVLVCNHQV